MPKNQNRHPGANQRDLLENSVSQQVGDVAAFVDTLSPKGAADTLAALPVEQSAETFDKPELNHAAELIELLPTHETSVVLGKMSSDRAADILQNLGKTARTRLLGLPSSERQAELRSLRSYPRDTAGGVMTTEFVSVPATSTVNDTLPHIRDVERSRETVYAIYILDPTSRKPLRTASLQRLITVELKALVLSICPGYHPIAVTPMADREDVARLITKYDRLAVPVVDDSGHVLGIVTLDDVIDAMIEESTEDVQKLGGMGALDRPYMDIGFFQMIKKRAGWLAALFMGEVLTASAIQHFEADVAKAVVLTLFIPLLMSSGGNSDAQATSLVTRAQALQELRLSQCCRVARELPTAIALGAFLGAIGIGRIALWQTAGFYDYGKRWLIVARTVGASLVAIATFGALAASMLPFALKELRFDPASASAPFAATLVDVPGIVIFFSIALLFLTGNFL